MSRISTRSAIDAFMASFVLLLLVMSTFGTVVSASSSAVAWNIVMPSPRYHDVDSISDLLLERPGSESRVLAKAKQLIQDLSSSTTCSHAPMVRLLQQCKNIKPKYENAQSDHQLNNAESVFAISMALCESHQARVNVPSACKIFQTMLERPPLEFFVEIVRSHEIEACSAALYDTPSWTSYSTYKSNSRFLCDSSRTDYQREELLQTLRDATDVIPEILETLNDHRTEAQFAMNQLRESAASVDSVQKEVLLHAREQGQAHSAQLKQLAQHFEALQETMAEAVTENSKVLALSTEKANDVDQKLTKLYASFVEAATGLTFDLDQQISLLSQQTTSVLGQIRDLGTQDSLDNLQATMHAMTQTALELTQLQAVQIATGQEVLHAFNNFSPEQLLPRWLAGFSTSTAKLISVLKAEGPFFIIFAAPTLVLLMFGCGKLSLSIFMVYLFAQGTFYLQARIQADMLASLLESQVLRVCINEVRYISVVATLFTTFETFGWHISVTRIAKCYLCCRVLSMFVQEHKYEMLTSLSLRQTQLFGLCLFIAFVICICICICTNVVLQLPISIYDQPRVVTEVVHEKRPKRDVKEEFDLDALAAFLLIATAPEIASPHPVLHEAPTC